MAQKNTTSLQNAFRNRKKVTFTVPDLTTELLSAYAEKYGVSVSRLLEILVDFATDPSRESDLDDAVSEAGPTKWTRSA